MPTITETLTNYCLCGCGNVATKGRWYLAGHDSKHLSKAGRAIVAGDAVTQWVMDMPSRFQERRLERYLNRRGIDLAHALDNERQDCV